MTPTTCLLLLAATLSPGASAGTAWMGGPRGENGAMLAPDPRGAGGLDRAFDLERLRLDLDLLVDDRAVAGTATLSLRRLGPGPVVLHQVALEIEAVQQDGADLSWHLDGDQLVVEVGPDFGAQQADAVTVRYRARPRTGLHFREGGRRSPDAWSEVWSQGEGEDNRHWFPSWDYPNDRFVYEGDIRGPEGWQVLTNSGLDMVNYLVMVAAGPYQVLAHPDAPEVQAWVPPGTAAAAVARVLDPVPEMMAHMGQRTGVAYPWGPYRQVFVQRFLYTGMENTSATVEHERLLLDARVDGTADGVESVVAHELAHQWYGDLLTCDGWRELWLNEGFATFIAADWFRVRYGEPAYMASVQGWRNGFRGADRPVAGRFFHGAGAAPNFGVYGKGAMVLHMLKQHLGEERFWQGVQRYTRTHERGLVETVDLQRAMEAVSGQRLDWFFQQWIDLGHVPELSVQRSWSEGRLSVTVRQRIDEDHPRYTLPVTIEVGAADGTVLRRTAWLEDEEAGFDLELSEAPAWVAFDPDLGLLAQVEDEQSDAGWMAQLDSPSPGARLAALAALGETDRSDAVQAFATDPQRHRSERIAAVQALSAQRATAALLALVDDPDAGVRRAAAQGLGGSPDDSPVGALQRVVRSDPNPDVRETALRSLAALDPQPALRLARGLLGLQDREERGLRQAALDVLGEHGVAADLALVLAPGAPDRLRNSGLSAGARIAGRQEGALRTRLSAQVARAAEAMLDDLDLRTRQHAIGVLREVGDERSVARLEAFRRQSTVPDVQEAARAAVTAIRGRSAPEPGGANEAQARIEALEERLQELEEELERVVDRH